MKYQESVAEKYLRLSSKFPDKTEAFSKRLREYCASIIIGRGFNQSLEDYFRANPKKAKEFNDANEVATELERIVKNEYSFKGYDAIKIRRCLP